MCQLAPSYLILATAADLMSALHEFAYPSQSEAESIKVTLESQEHDDILTL